MRTGNKMVESIKELRKICQSGKPTKGNTLYLYNYALRKFSIYITRLLIPTGIHAHQVTLLMVLLTFIAAVMLATGSYQYLIIGALLLEFVKLLDDVNGEVARYRKEDGLFGKYMENWTHFITVPLIFIGLSVGVYSATNSILPILSGFAIVYAYLLHTAVDQCIYEPAVQARLGQIKIRVLPSSNESKIIDSNVQAPHKKRNPLFYLSVSPFNFLRRILMAEVIIIDVILLGAILTPIIPVVHLLFFETTPLGLILFIYAIMIVMRRIKRSIYSYLVAQKKMDEIYLSLKI